jgi:uncharacterized damage-inducible protein DinB
VEKPDLSAELENQPNTSFHREREWIKIARETAENLKYKLRLGSHMTASDLVRYNHAVRELYLDALSKLPWAEVAAPKGLSFDSARNVFIHMTLVEDRWINYVIPNRFSEWKDSDFEKFQNIESLRHYANQTKISTEKFLKNLTPQDLNRKITIPWGNKPDSQITLETALVHMVIEDMIHCGELSALLWQMGQEAPYVAFWRFSQNQES